MSGPQDFSSALPNDDTWCHGVARSRARHYRSICNAKVLNSIDLEIAVDNRHCIASHLGRTRLMPISDSPLANEVFQLSPLQVSRHHLAFDVWTESHRVANLARKFHGRYCGLQIIWVSKGIR